MRAVNKAQRETLITETKTLASGKCNLKTSLALCLHGHSLASQQFFFVLVAELDLPPGQRLLILVFSYFL